MAKLLVVYHSGYGHTKVVAERVAKGASISGVEVTLWTVDQATPKLDDIPAFDGILFGSPTYMGNYSGQFKTFLDACSKLWMKQALKGKLAGGFTNSGGLSGDKLQTLTAMWVNAMQHGMIWVGNSLMSEGSAVTSLNRLSSYTGVMTQSDHGTGPDISPPEADRQTAELFGKRFAETLLRWTSTR